MHCRRQSDTAVEGTLVVDLWRSRDYVIGHYSRSLSQGSEYLNIRITVIEMPSQFGFCF
jgi:hypothetical protein